MSDRAAKRWDQAVRFCLGGATALETLECALRLAEIHGTFLKFRAVDLGALIKAGVLNGRRCRNTPPRAPCKRFVTDRKGFGSR
jgi:hypothetical protein